MKAEVISALAQEWLELEAKEKCCREAYRSARLDGGSARLGDASTAWFGTASAILRFLVKEEEFARQMLGGIVRPEALLSLLADICESSANGQTHLIIKHASRKRGSPGPGARERFDRFLALYVLEAARAGRFPEIPPRSAMKYVSDTYGITRQSIEGWRNKRDELFAEFEYQLPPNGKILSLMQQKARQYKANKNVETLSRSRPAKSAG